jgi:hypothetical protein
MAEYYLSVCMYHIFLIIHQLFDFLAFMNSAAMNLGAEDVS